jgi:hypothetical protein
MADHKRRRHQRCRTDKPAFIQNDVAGHPERRCARSSGDAAPGTEYSDHRIGDDPDLALELDESGSIFGNATRTRDVELAMRFDLYEEGEDRLICEITGFQSGLIAE